LNFNNSHKTVIVILVAVFFLFNSPFLVRAQDSITANQSIQTYFDIARTYRHQNQLAPALEALEYAAEKAEKEENIKALLDTYHKFALLYLELDNNETTLFYWDRAGVLLKDIEYPYGSAVHKYIDATLLFREANKFQARQKLEEAKAFSNDKNLLNNMLLLEARIFLELENYKEAATNYNALLVNSDKDERSYLATQANLGLAGMYYKQNKLEESSKHAQAALALSKKHQFFKSNLEANRFLAKINEELGDYVQSLIFNKNLAAIKDSLFTIEKLKQEAKTADKIRFQQQSTVISELQTKNEELNQSASRSEITAILASAFLTIISISL